MIEGTKISSAKERMEKARANERTQRMSAKKHTEKFLRNTEYRTGKSQHKRAQEKPLQNNARKCLHEKTQGKSPCETTHRGSPEEERTEKVPAKERTEKIAAK